MDTISKAKKLQAMHNMKTRLYGSHSSPAGEIYDEYVERSRSLRGVPAHLDMAEESQLEMNLVDQETNIQDKEVVLKEQVAELTNKGDKEAALKEEDDREKRRVE
ncbi:hypothetical protein SADUNF_Sadunf03G0129400 [Salix dunnii]|uniref:Uncharacterized protein n=1 Tax=Salix dunnii TaxID=1413687 RepID=A0A835N4L4_9ROSI|nr:hypothetical protein SADUNF_Sadunf03G0129400 [Salix dunnii]